MTKLIREQLEGRINKYAVRIQEGIELTREEAREYTDLRREYYHIEHRDRIESKRITFRRIRDYNDGGVI